MIRVALLEDEPLARLAIKTRLARYPAFSLVAEYADGDTAAAGIAHLRPDLLFVDIGLPGQSGLEVLTALAPAHRPMAILLTAYDNFAVQAFALDALDYLLKPLDDERFDEALGRAARALPYRSAAQVTTRPPPVWIRQFSVCLGSRVLLIGVDEVQRIDADGDYAALHARGKTYLLRARLQTLATQLDPRQFQRVHRCAIVRLDMVSELRTLTNRDCLLRLHDGTLMRASRTYMPALMDALARRQTISST